MKSAFLLDYPEGLTVFKGLEDVRRDVAKTQSDELTITIRNNNDPGFDSSNYQYRITLLGTRHVEGHAFTGNLQHSLRFERRDELLKLVERLLKTDALVAGEKSRILAGLKAGR